MSKAVAGGRATLAMVAAAAGVSTPTVSKVLHGRPDVAAATRARVEQALADCGYVPPQNQERRRVHTVNLVCDDLLAPYTSEVLRGVTKAANLEEMDVVVALLQDVAGSTPQAWTRRLRAAGHEGIIVVACELTDAQLTALDRARMPLVAIDPLSLPSIEVASVGSTNAAGGVDATEYLVGLGHRRIAFVGGPVTSTCGQARLHGYLAAMSNARLRVDTDLVSHGPFVTPTGLAEGQRLLGLGEPPTAVIAGNDSIAIGVIEAARQRGLAVPADLSVVGFDDTYLAESSTPPLTTVRQPLQEMGAFAFRTLLRVRDGKPPGARHTELATQLVIRSSTARPAT
ncbi:LacI family DNA-binding transcriptional regulator [Kribbella sp. VKM Ac-2568]|uniref:LacI family DNA-binding transcriptional regulator n=1 Tax=Kribbella sp. VKM Ac-2568 TaxID=2512219 RepID=UPI0010EEE277|nr:LacI family DNA-binding transcriptional regulator [Kribbella sp. VKM Ac-2568]TCM47167.1 LacI family transcriptional regulator [Kribbella sp. VKM Ac-2568]